MDKDKKKLKLVLQGEETRELPKPSKLRFNTNGRKTRRGKNLYKRKLNRLRKSIRW